MPIAKTGKLLMIWSSFGTQHYAAGVAESESGKIAGPWKQVEKPLFATNGAHGMILKTFDNRLLLVVLHQPNTSLHERARFFGLGTPATPIPSDADKHGQILIRHGFTRIRPPRPAAEINAFSALGVPAGIRRPTGESLLLAGTPGARNVLFAL